MPAGAPTNKLVFANQLRGIAALLVAASHLAGVFWGMRVFVAGATFSPVQTGPAPAIYDLLSYHWFEFGPFGVALFFLISGMVIPYSLDKHTRWTFFLARILRIYPTFIAALMLEMLVLYLASRFWHRPFGFNARTIIANGLLINDLTGDPVIDFVNWTLAIEIKFYLLVMLVAPAVRSGRIGVLFCIATFILLIDLAISRVLPGADLLQNSNIVNATGSESPYLIFMLIGILFNFHERKYYGYVALIGAISAMCLLFVCSWRLGVQKIEYPVVTSNYLMAIVLFGALYAARRMINNHVLFDFIASISFPFYLIHAVLGFTIMKYLIVALGLNDYLALGCAVTIVTAVAFLFHRTIETVTIRMGRKLAQRPADATS